MNCKICGSCNLVQSHHIIKGRGKRKKCETKESLIPLCWECHHGTRGVHGRDGKELDKRLKLELQMLYFGQGKDEVEVLELMGGKLYLKDGEVYR